MTPKFKPLEWERIGDSWHSGGYIILQRQGKDGHEYVIRSVFSIFSTKFTTLHDAQLHAQSAFEERITESLSEYTEDIREWVNDHLAEPLTITIGGGDE